MNCNAVMAVSSRDILTTDAQGATADRKTFANTLVGNLECLTEGSLIMRDCKLGVHSISISTIAQLYVSSTQAQLPSDGNLACCRAVSPLQVHGSRSALAGPPEPSGAASDAATLHSGPHTSAKASIQHSHQHGD